MAFHVVGWFENQDSAVLINALALADESVRVVGDNVTVPELNNLMGAYAWGADIVLAQLASPSLRKKANLDLQPVDAADEPTSNPPYHDFMNNPIPLVHSEFLRFMGSEDNAGAGDMACFAWLMDKFEPIPKGEQFTVRTTNATTLVADAWTNGALTFTQALPAGEYSVVGMRAQSAGLRCARLVPVGGRWRPGVIGFDGNGDIEPDRFRNGQAGEFCRFKHDEPPTVDFMSLSADTAQIVWLDLIQTKAET